MAAVEVRPLTEDEVPAVERAVRKMPGKHRERLAQQERGEGVYLWAWIGDEPVGHVLLVLRRAGTAELEDLAVDEPWRRGGIGRQLVERCEGEALARGFDRMIFAVGLENRSARAFYRSLGFSEAEDQEPHLVTWPHLTESGAVVEDSEWCTNFTKQLRSTALPRATVTAAPANADATLMTPPTIASSARPSPPPVTTKGRPHDDGDADH